MAHTDQYSRELADLALDGLFVQPLDVAIRHHFERALHIDLDEIVVVRTNFVSHCAIGRNRRRDGDYAVTGKKAAHETDPANVDVAIFLAEAEALRQVFAYRIAIQYFDFRAGIAQTLFEDAGNGALTRAGKAREPKRETLVTQQVTEAQP